MNFSDLSATLLAACGGDTVKVFDVSKQPNDASKQPSDPCVLSYCPSPGFQVNSVKWNHTNLVVASAGDDKKISFWHKKGGNMGTLPIPKRDSRDDIDDSIVAISYSNKSSRYLCSGGSGQVVRIWDLQRKRCIKWLRGHTATITGVMYNCKDEYIASINSKGDLILHNLASGARATELRDPNEQNLKVLDYSRTGRHVLVTAGDDGSVHLWDTTGRNPKNSWTKLHSAPTTGVSFCPSNDKLIATVGFDKKLHILDTGARRPSFSTSYEAPFSSLAFNDDGSSLVAGTSNGQVVFYDVRGKPQPITVLRAYNNSEPITSLCWQRSKPVLVNENTCTAETALLGLTGEDSVVMPDPRPSLTSTNLSTASLLTTTHATSYLSTTEDTPQRSHLLVKGALSRLQAPHSSYSFSDDMDVFSPIVEAHPITPSWWDDLEENKKNNSKEDSKSIVLPQDSKQFPFSEDGKAELHPISNWKSYSSSQQAETHSTLSELNSTPVATKTDQLFSPSPPEAWGANLPYDKSTQLRQPFSKPSRFMPSGSLSTVGLMSGSISAGLQDFPTSSYASDSSLTTTSLRSKDNFKNEVLSRFLDQSSVYTSTSSSSDIKSGAAPVNLDVSESIHLTLPKKFSTYAERISTSSFSEGGVGLNTGSPKLKKTGAETREELVSSYFSRLDTTGATTVGSVPTMNGLNPQVQRSSVQTEEQLGSSSFTLQLFQRTVEESLSSIQNSMHEAVHNLHVEVLRQAHILETEMYRLNNSQLEKIADLTKEVQSLRKENQQLRQLL